MLWKVKAGIMQITCKTNISKISMLKDIITCGDDISIVDGGIRIEDSFDYIVIQRETQGITYAKNFLSLEDFISGATAIYFTTAMSGFHYSIRFLGSHSELTYDGAWNGFNQQTLKPWRGLEVWDVQCHSSIFGDCTLEEMIEKRKLLDKISINGESRRFGAKVIPAPTLRSIETLCVDDVYTKGAGGLYKGREWNTSLRVGSGLANSYVLAGVFDKQSTMTCIVDWKEYIYIGREVTLKM